MSGMAGEPCVLHEQHGAVAELVVNRPKALNALNAEVVDELGRLIAQLAGDGVTRAVVLRGSGEKAFVAGADIAAMAEMGPLEAERFAAAGQAVLDTIATCPVPVIAAVHGFALGGGCELAMACDIVLAGERARFGQPEVNLGVIPGFGGTQRLVRRVGAAVALDLCLTGRMVDADEAVRVGLASRKVEGDVREAALEVAREIAQKGPIAVRLAKRAIHENADLTLQAAQAAEKSLFALCFASADQREGMAAFLAKRKPEFQGR